MRVKVGIMQPYFFPYIGYFQLIAYCDVFILYDDVEYTKRGWITRNRIQDSGNVRTFSLSLRRDDDDKRIAERVLADDFDRLKLIRRLEAPYKRAPYFHEMSGLVGEAVRNPGNNLYEFLESAIALTMAGIKITTPILRSSLVLSNASLRGQERVLALCSEVGATTYVNPIGGTTLYSANDFKSRGFGLEFLRSNLTPYPQGSKVFEPAMSIIDVIACCGLVETADLSKNDFTILQGANL